jgi:hypothetical protein
MKKPAMADSRITDPDVAILAALAADKESEYSEDDAMWEGSPFRWIKTRPSRQIGAIGESLVAGWCATRGFDVIRSHNSDADRVIAGHAVEIKFSTLWTNNLIYKFQQIRDQEYDYLFALGVSPFDAQAWFIPKAELLSNRPPALVPQHGGAAGRDTKWLSFTATSPPEWLDQFGGRLADVAKLITSIGQGKR